MIRTLDQELAEHPFFTGLDADALRFVAGCAQNQHVEAGEYLFREGQPAGHFYVVRHGRLALEVVKPGAGRLVVDTVEDRDVLGWSWLVPPHRWFFDARAVEPVSLIALDGVCLRGKCEEDPRLGYDLLQRVTQVMYQRLQATRVRLLDLYGDPRAARR